MKPNVGTVDRIIRAVAGLALLATYPLGILQGVPGLIALVVGVVLLVTAAIRWCPPYTLLGINTGASDD